MSIPRGCASEGRRASSANRDCEIGNIFSFVRLVINALQERVTLMAMIKGTVNNVPRTCLTNIFKFSSIRLTF